MLRPATMYRSRLGISTNSARHRNYLQLAHARSRCFRTSSPSPPSLRFTDATYDRETTSFNTFWISTTTDSSKRLFDNSSATSPLSRRKSSPPTSWRSVFESPTPLVDERSSTNFSTNNVWNDYFEIRSFFPLSRHGARADAIVVDSPTTLFRLLSTTPSLLNELNLSRLFDRFFVRSFTPHLSMHRTDRYVSQR